MGAKKEEKKSEETFPAGIGENAEEIATAIAKISRGMEVLNESRLKPRAILMLIARSANVPMDTVSRVLEAMTELEKTYLKK